MKEKDVLKLSVFLSISGIIIIYLFSAEASFPLMNIDNITNDDAGSYVKICGFVSLKYTSQKGTVFLDVQDETGKINVVFFKDAVSDLDIYDVMANNPLCVSGTVTIYKNQLEIIGKRIHK